MNRRSFFGRLLGAAVAVPVAQLAYALPAPPMSDLERAFLEGIERVKEYAGEPDVVIMHPRAVAVLKEFYTEDYEDLSYADHGLMGLLQKRAA